MAGSVNKVILVGNLGKDPDVRTTSMGTKVVNLNLATSDSWNDKQTGERKENTEWHHVVIFNERLADVAEKYLRKGRKVFVEGQLKTRKWTDSQGIEKFTTEVVLDRFRGDLVLLDTQNSGEGYGQSQQPQTTKPQAPKSKIDWGPQTLINDAPKKQGGWDAGASTSNDLDDEIPF